MLLIFWVHAKILNSGSRDKSQTSLAIRAKSNRFECHGGGRVGDLSHVKSRKILLWTQKICPFVVCKISNFNVNCKAFGARFLYWVDFTWDSKSIVINNSFLIAHRLQSWYRKSSGILEYIIIYSWYIISVQYGISAQDRNC